MKWIIMGWRNLWRNRRRSLIELTSIAGSIFIAVFFNNLAKGSYAQIIREGVKMGSGHIGLYHTSYLDLRKTELTIDANTLIPLLEDLPEVKAVYPRLYVPSLVRSSHDSRASVVIGMDMSREKLSNPLLRTSRIVEGEIPSDDDTKGVLMGEALVNELGLGVGKKFVLMTQDVKGDITSRLFRVSGIIRTNARMIDASTIIIPRNVLSDVIGRQGKAHEIAVMLTDHTRIAETLPKIKAIAHQSPDTDAYPWDKAMPDMADAIKMDYVGLRIMVAFMYLIVGIGTINTLLMSVMERTREFGVIRALGMKKSGLRKIVLAEAAVLAVTGVAAGIVAAVAVGLYTSTKGIDYSSLLKDHGFAGILVDPIIYSIWDWSTTFWLSVAMILLAIVASLYPARFIMKVQPSDAMRK